MQYLTDEQRALQDSIRTFLKKECSPDYVRMLEEKEEFPSALWDKTAELGLMGLTIPEEYGGTGGKVIDAVIAVEELSYAMATLASLYTLSAIFGVEMLLHFGTDKQKKELLPQLAAGKIRFSVGMTEANAGSDISGVKTTAVDDGEHYVVNGSKIFTTGIEGNDYVLLLARTGPPAEKNRNLSLFLVDKKIPGITISPIRQLAENGVRANEVGYDNVRVPKENLIGRLNRGFYQILHLMNTDRIVYASFAVGHAQRSLDYSLNYAKERVQFGKPIGQFQAISHMFADMATEITAARALIYHAARLQDASQNCSKEASMAKLFASEVAKRTAVNGVQAMGAYGYMMEYDMQRFLRESMQFTIAGGTSQIQRNHIAREIGL
jgi:acyl-CoA dehydrogenase